MSRFEREALLEGTKRTSGRPQGPRLQNRGVTARAGAVRRQGSRLRLRSLWLAGGLALLSLRAPHPALASGGGEVRLTRRYRSGQKMVYATKMHTKAVIHSEPPELQSLLPPLPTDFTMQQQNTMTVKGVRSDGSADIENHFDEVEFQSDLAERAPESLRESALRAQQEISEHVAGQDIVAHYDRNGRLLGFEGGEGLFAQLDLAYQEPLRQALRFFLEQVGGDTLYPGFPVTPGKTWKRKLESAPSPAYPYNVEGENTLRYVGSTKVGGIKAAVVEFSFVNVVRPVAEALGKAEPLAQLASHGLGVDMRIDGQGQGRVLLALDDGRVLQSHANIHQTLNAHLDQSAPLPFRNSQPLKLEVQSDSEMDVVGVSK